MDVSKSYQIFSKIDTKVAIKGEIGKIQFYNNTHCSITQDFFNFAVLKLLISYENHLDLNPYICSLIFCHATEYLRRGHAKILKRHIHSLLVFISLEPIVSL